MDLDEHPPPSSQLAWQDKFILYSSNFSWHNIFVNFMIWLMIIKISSWKFSIMVGIAMCCVVQWALACAMLADSEHVHIPVHTGTCLYFHSKQITKVRSLSRTRKCLLWKTSRQIKSLWCTTGIRNGSSFLLIRFSSHLQTSSPMPCVRIVGRVTTWIVHAGAAARW